MDFDISIGVVNCNRLYYLAATVDSIIETTSKNKVELIIVDNGSIEPGTDEYVRSLIDNYTSETLKIIYHKQQGRDPKNEYAKALNIIALTARADLILPMPGDVQFIEKGWVDRYIHFFKEYKDIIGCVAIDAQRKKRLESELFIRDTAMFWMSVKRPPIAGAGNVVYHKDILKRMYPWDTNNGTHEGTLDNSETKMLNKMTDILAKENRHMYIPTIPCAVAICNPDGSTAFVRNDKRYGTYERGEYKGSMYYEIRNEMPLHIMPPKNRPLSIEEIALPYMWEKPLDREGNWIKLANEYDKYTTITQNSFDTSNKE